MEEENEAIIFALVIGAVILGIGLAMFFTRPYTGFGAVVLAIGLMTLSLILTMRAEEIIHLKVYPTSSRSKNTAKVSVEPQSPTDSTPPYDETRTQEVSEPESYEDQVEQTSEVLEVEDVQEVEETESYTPNMYEPERGEEAEPQPEYEPEPSIEAAPPSTESDQETEEPQEDTAPVITTN